MEALGGLVLAPSPGHLGAACTGLHLDERLRRLHLDERGQAVGMYVHLLADAYVHLLAGRAWTMDAHCALGTGVDHGCRCSTSRAA